MNRKKNSAKMLRVISNICIFFIVEIIQNMMLNFRVSLIAIDLIFSGLGEKSPLWNDFDLVIRPTSPNGLILYNGDQNNPNGDFVAIFLSNGFIKFAFDAGDGATIVR